MKKSIIKCFVAGVFVFNAFFAFSQEALKSTQAEYFDFLSLTGFANSPTLGYRTLSDAKWILENEDEETVWDDHVLGTTFNLFSFSDNEKYDLKVRLYGPNLYNSFNTSTPYGYNDGALWQGRGYNASFTGGSRLEWGGFELTFKPVVTFSQNLPYDYLKGLTEYNYFTEQIDFVQRYGDKAFFQYDWGDSEIRYTYGTFTLGFGTQTPWLGPAKLNPMLGSNNAPSYPKLDYGLRRTKVTIPWTDIYIGDVEFRGWVGYLSLSDYADNSYTYDTMLNALNFSYAPSFIDGLTLTLNRIFTTKWSLSKLYYHLNLYSKKEINDQGDGEDQKVALSFDWKFPKVGFEMYGEFGLDDYSACKIANPFHTAIYTVGFCKSIDFKSPLIRSEFIFEYNNFEMSQDFQMQWCYYGYYTHSFVRSGYTNNGQILGAGTGYMGNSQYIEYRLYYPKGQTSLFVHRHSNNNNYIYNIAVTRTNEDEIMGDYWACHETYLSSGFNTSYFLTKSLQLDFGFTYSLIYFKNYIRSEWGNNNNFQFRLGASYNL